MENRIKIHLWAHAIKEERSYFGILALECLGFSPIPFHFSVYFSSPFNSRVELNMPLSSLNYQ